MQFLEIFKYDFRLRLKQPMIYIFFLVIFFLCLMSLLSDNVNIGSTFVDNISLNAPYAIMSQVGFMSLFVLLMATAINNGGALRDFNYQFNEIIFTTPTLKGAYIFGRFFSSFLLSAIPSLGVLLSFAFATALGDPEDIGTTYTGAYWSALVVFILPNAFIFSAILFAVASLTKSSIMSFVAAMTLFILYLNASVTLVASENTHWLWLADPFGLTLFNDLTKYWTIVDKQTQWIGLTGVMLWNRILWMGISAVILLFTYYRFKFEIRKKSPKKDQVKSASPANKTAFQVLEELPSVGLTFNLATEFKQLIAQYKIDFSSIWRSGGFKILAALGVFIVALNMNYVDSWFGTGNLPVTYLMISAVRNSLPLFIIIIIGFYSGELIWKERNAKIYQLIDASPVSSWVPVTSKFLALSAMVGFILAACILTGMLFQTIKGFTDYDIEQYLVELLVIDLAQFVVVIALAIFIHLLVNNLYLGFFLFIVLVLVNTFLWNALSIHSNLIVFTGLPDYSFSDMVRWATVKNGLVGFTAYWLTVGLLLIVVNSLLAPRGVANAWKERWRLANLRFDRKASAIVLVLLFVWLGIGAHLFYQTKVLNTSLTEGERKELSAEFEKQYKKYEGKAQPKIIKADYKVDLFPEERGFEAHINLWALNKSQEVINEIHFTMPETFDVDVELDAELVTDNKILGYQIFKLLKPLAPGDSLQVDITSTYFAKGIENEIELPNLTQNGIFINNSTFMPTIGYNRDRELSDKEDRELFGLEERQNDFPLSRSYENCNTNFISQDADWVQVSFQVSTSLKQTAIAPGTLIKNWQEGGRNYFIYELEKPVLNFFAFLSANYTVKRAKWEDVDLEVYYHEPHGYNVDKMLNSMKVSLDFYSKIYGPYPHGQARIIEFPRFAKFAQAFPGTMPYSESIGFIADLKDKKDIDFVTYAVAHEMAHQWWAHQVVGANVAGAAMLSETLSQHSALQVMEKLYGKNQSVKFLKHELNTYLAQRGQSQESETPLLEVGNSQSFLYYNKGSLIMNAIKNYIGEDSLNMALKRFYNKYKYSDGNYPTAWNLWDELVTVTPYNLSHILDDYLTTITLYENKVDKAIFSKTEDGKYKIEAEIFINKFETDGEGNQIPKTVKDPIEVAVYSKDNDDIPVYRRFHNFKQGKNSISILVETEPQSVSLDPGLLLVDRFIEDNKKEVKHN